MTDSDLAAIESWAAGWASEGSPDFQAVLNLVAAYRERGRMNESLCDKLAICSDTIKSLAERCHQQSELLGKKAEKTG